MSSNFIPLDLTSTRAPLLQCQHLSNDAATECHTNSTPILKERGLPHDTYCVKDSEGQTRKPGGYPTSRDMNSTARHPTWISKSPTMADYRMLTSTSLLQLPRSSPMHDLAVFLRTTGPRSPPHVVSNKDAGLRQTPSSYQNAFKLFRTGSRRRKLHDGECERSNDSTPGETLPRQDTRIRTPPRCVDQKVSMAGTKYLALQIPELPSIDGESSSLYLSSDSLTSTDMIGFTDSFNTGGASDPWVPTLTIDKQLVCPRHGGIVSKPQRGNRVVSRPRDPLPVPSYPETKTSNQDAPFQARSSFEALRSYQRASERTKAVAKLNLSSEIGSAGSCQEVHIEQPLPIRPMNHHVLLQQSIGDSPDLFSQGTNCIYSNAFSSSPETLREQPDRLLEQGGQKLDSRYKLTVTKTTETRIWKEHDTGSRKIGHAVTTDCSGPISKSQTLGGHATIQHPAYPASRRAREAHSHNLRPLPKVNTEFNTTKPLHLPSTTPATRLQKLRPPPLTLRSKSTPGRHLPIKTEKPPASAPTAPFPFTLSPAPHEPSTPRVPILRQRRDGNGDGGGNGNADAVTYPIEPQDDFSGIPTDDLGDPTDDSGVCLSPVMRVAEEVPVLRCRSRATELRIEKGGKNNGGGGGGGTSGSGMSGFSTTGFHSSGVGTSSLGRSDTGTAEGSGLTVVESGGREVVDGARGDVARNGWDSETSGTRTDRRVARWDGVEMGGGLWRDGEKLSGGPRTMAESRSIDARIEALERSNAALSAALMAVLGTSGVRGAGVGSLLSDSTREERVRGHLEVAESENEGGRASGGSALEMYMSTRRGGPSGVPMEKLGDGWD